MKVIHEVTKGLKQVAEYLGDVVMFDSDPSTHVKTTRALFERHCASLPLSSPPRKPEAARRTPILWATSYRPRA